MKTKRIKHCVVCNEKHTKKNRYCSIQCKNHAKKYLSKYKTKEKEIEVKKNV